MGWVAVVDGQEKLKMPKGLKPLSKQELNLLATYNSEIARGVVHTSFWNERMTTLKQRLSLVGVKRPKKERWFWKYLRGG